MSLVENVPIKNTFKYLINPRLSVLNDNTISSDELNYHIVFFVNCNMNKNYYEWIYYYVNRVKDFENFNMYVVATIADEKKNELVNRIKSDFDWTNLHVETYDEKDNPAHEYPGIKKIYDLSQTYNKSTDILFYYHSKNITRIDHFNVNANIDLDILFNQPKVTDVFKSFSFIDKVVYSTNNLLWGWFNFWYVRGSYLSKHNVPIMNKNRYYFESYIGHTNKGATTNFFDAFTLQCNTNNYNIGTIFNPNNITYVNI